jgi:MarR family transcriptional regulator, organic hydroperoxide resistance regulator
MMSEKPINDYLAHLLMQANRHVTRQLASEGVSVEQWRVLKVISQHGGLTMREMARMLSLHHPTLTKIVDKMVAEALVYRVPDPDDRRKIRIFISEKGKGVLQQQNERVGDHQVKVEDQHGPDEVRKLKAMLEQFISSTTDLDEKGDD